MMKNSDRIAKLLALFSTGGLSEQEKQELSEWAVKDERHRHLMEELASSETFAEKYRKYRTINTGRIQAHFERQTGIRRRISLKRTKWAAVAAMLVLGIGSALFFRDERDRTKQLLLTQTDVPGKAGVTLLLGNGEKVNLIPGDTARVNLPEAARLTEGRDGLVYAAATEKKQEYNTLQVPRGGEYKVMLGDGSFVHLNAGSELRYPVSFQDTVRTVYLSGEAWFEIKKDAERPFYVKTEQVQVRVYGTAFAVNTLFEGQTTVALVNGKIGLIADGKEEELEPSQLGVYNHAEHTIQINTTDLAPYTAWREGLLVFNDEPLGQILHRLALWYDIEVFYMNEASRQETFTGYLKRYDNIEVILKALQKTIAVKFELKGRTLTVR